MYSPKIDKKDLTKINYFSKYQHRKNLLVFTYNMTNVNKILDFTKTGQKYNTDFMF